MSRSRRQRRLLLGALSVAVWGTTSLIATPARASAGCQLSAPLTAQLLHNQYEGLPFYSFVSFSAANAHGTLGGVASDGFGNYELLRYDLGTRKLQILDRMSFNPWIQFGSVLAVGVDNAGDITYRVTHIGGSAASTQGIKYAGTSKYVLAHASNWRSWTPNSVAADGTVYGDMYDGTSSRVVRWVGSGAGTVTYLTGAGSAYGGYVLSNGAVAFNSNGSPVVRLPNGVAVNLGGGGPPGLGLGAGPLLWGWHNAGSGVGALKWQPSTSDAWAQAVPAQPVSQLGYVTAAGPDGTAVGNAAGSTWPDRGPRLLLRPGIPIHHMPAQFIEADGPTEAPVAVTATGSVVYTGTDGLAPIWTCTA